MEEYGRILAVGFGLSLAAMACLVYWLRKRNTGLKKKARFLYSRNNELVGGMENDRLQRPGCRVIIRLILTVNSLVSSFEVLLHLVFGFELAFATFLGALVHGFGQVVDQVVDELPISLDLDHV